VADSWERGNKYLGPIQGDNFFTSLATISLSTITPLCRVS